MLDNLETLKKLPLFPPNFTPSTVEIFDQYGLLVSLVLGETVGEYKRNSAQTSEYIAWFLDGELGLILQSGTIIFNRLDNMALIHEMLEK
jgi:hypothetical protein